MGQQRLPVCKNCTTATFERRRSMRDRGKAHKIVVFDSGEGDLPAREGRPTTIAEQVTAVPDGQISSRAVHLRVQPRSQKYSAFRMTQISGYLGASRSDKRGGSRVVTNAERDAVDARASGVQDDRRARQLVSGNSAQDERRC